MLAAAVAHATWNALAHSISDKLVAMGWMGAGGAACAVPLVVLAPPPAASAWPYLLSSVGVHILYNAGLIQSYKRGDFGQAYPIARGTAPLVVALLAAVFVGEVPTAFQSAGILLIFLALAGLAVAGTSTAHGSDRWAVAVAIGTGLTIAVYTVIDGVGVRRSGSSLGYVGWLILLQGTLAALAAVGLRRTALRRQLPATWLRGLTGGAFSLAAYGLVLWAQTHGALGPISALRETSIIIGALIGTIVFHERFGRARIVASTVAALGIVLLAIP